MLRARQNGGGKLRGLGGRGDGNGSPAGRGNSSANPPTPWDPSFKGANLVTLTNSNFTATIRNTAATRQWVGGSAKTTGKLYFEILCENPQFGVDRWAGLISSTATPDGGTQNGTTSACRQVSDVGWSSGVSAPVSGSASYAAGDVFGCAVDLNAKTIQVYKNNVANGSASLANLSFTGGVRPGANTLIGAFDNVYTIRTTVSEFSYAPPSGYAPWAEGV